MSDAGDLLKSSRSLSHTHTDACTHACTHKYTHTFTPACTTLTEAHPVVSPSTTPGGLLQKRTMDYNKPFELWP